MPGRKGQERSEALKKVDSQFFQLNDDPGSIIQSNGDLRAQNCMER
jgi:hypothetical protein